MTEVRVSSDAMLNVWGSAFVSGAMTTLRNYAGLPEDVAHRIARAMVAASLEDPAVRETILESIRQVVTGEGVEGLFARLPVYHPEEGRS